MAVRNSSLHSIAEQTITALNTNIAVLTQLTSLVNNSDPSTTFSIPNAQGVLTTFTIPNNSFLSAEINRLSNNINSLAGLNNSTTTLQIGSNIFKKIYTVDLNLEPKDIPAISVPTSFVSEVNYLLDNMLSPEIFVEMDLTGMIDSDVRKISSLRYIVEFEIDSIGDLTDNGRSALNSFNSTFKGQSNINLNDYLNWSATTPGVLNGSNPNSDQKVFDLEPNELQYYGIFSVLKIVEDSLNNTLWYYLNTTGYTNIQTGAIKQLTIGDSLIINIDNSNTVYQITNISYAASNPAVTLTKVDGMQPVPVGVATMKYYSPIFNNQKVRINVGYNERNILFIKALNTKNFLLSKNWSQGIGYWTNELSLSSTDAYNGFSLPTYYTNVITDYGAALRDLVKTIPTALGATPSAPLLVSSNFLVVQTNTHLTNNSNTATLKTQSAQVSSLNTQLQQLSSAITDKNNQLKIDRFTTDADRIQFNNDLANLQNQYTQISQLHSSINTQILNSATLTGNTPDPTFAVRGFITIPAPTITTNTVPQQIVKIDFQYQTVSTDGSAPTVQTFALSDTNVNPTSPKTAAFSNWIPVTSLSRTQTYDKSTGYYTWTTNNQTDPDVVNINQLDIPIQPNETILIRARSISEVGFPNSPLMSDWSNTISIAFPTSLNSSSNQISAITQNAQNNAVKTSLMTDLNNQGLNDLLSQKTVQNGTTYYMSADKILSGQKDVNGNPLDMQSQYLDLLNKYNTLSSLIMNVQGQLSITVIRSGVTPYTVTNGTKLQFTINCEEYADPFTGVGIPTGRVYTNRIYRVDDFVLKIANTSTTNTLGLLSNLTYTNGNNNDIYNNAVPQIFWVDNQNELITSDATGVSKTQLDNQFLWSLNFDSVNQTSVAKLSDDINNSFVANGNNSLTSILSEIEFNLGYNSNSVLTFNSNNKSLMEDAKWIDTSLSVASNNKLLSTIHPSVKELTDIVDSNSLMVHNLTGGDANSVNIPLYVYFKMNANDTSLPGKDNAYIVLNGVTENVRHTKELKFLLATSTQEFSFSIEFIINRVSPIQQKNIATSPSHLVSNRTNS